MFHNGQIGGAGIAIFENYSAKIGRSRILPKLCVILFLEKHGKFKGCYELPFGSVDRGEAPIDAARRETYEESCKLIYLSRRVLSYSVTHGNNITYAVKINNDGNLKSINYINNRENLKKQRANVKYLETKGMIRVPIENIRAITGTGRDAYNVIDATGKQIIIGGRAKSFVKHIIDEQWFRSLQSINIIGKMKNGIMTCKSL
jgi:hypothetical protein